MFLLLFGLGIPLLFQFIKFLVLTSAIHALLAVPVVTAVYLHKEGDAAEHCSAFNRGEHTSDFFHFEVFGAAYFAK